MVWSLEHGRPPPAELPFDGAEEARDDDEEVSGEPAEGEDLHVKNHPGGVKVTKHRHHKDRRSHKGKHTERGDDVEDPKHNKKDKHDPPEADPGYHQKHKGHNEHKHHKHHKHHA